MQCQYRGYSTPSKIFLYFRYRNLTNANCTENRVCTSCDTVVLGFHINTQVITDFQQNQLQCESATCELEKSFFH